MKGATRWQTAQRQEVFIISIHAPVKGATRTGRRQYRPRKDFNPRTREGCDMEFTYFFLYVTLDFNPRTREGCDRMEIIDFTSYTEISIHAPVKGATLHFLRPW